jgi:hypothetical protein
VLGRVVYIAAAEKVWVLVWVPEGANPTMDELRKRSEVGGFAGQGGVHSTWWWAAAAGGERVWVLTWVLRGWSRRPWVCRCTDGLHPLWPPWCSTTCLPCRLTRATRL